MSWIYCLKRVKSSLESEIEMEYVHAALILHSTGNEITEDKIKAILEAAGVEVDDNRVKALVASLNDVDIEEAIQSASVFAAAPAAGTAAAAPSAAAESGAAVAEEEEEEEEEEEDELGLTSLFG